MSEENFGNSVSRQVARASIGPLLIFMVAFYFYYVACCLAPAPMGQLGADFWPKMILAALMGSCVIKMGEIIWNRDKLAEEAEARPIMDNVKLTAMIVILIVTVFAIDYIGFTLANTLFMIIFLRLVGFSKPIPLALVSVLSTVVMLYIFVKVVYLPLPKGYGFFEDISLYIYRALFLL